MKSLFIIINIFFGMHLVYAQEYFLNFFFSHQKTNRGQLSGNVKLYTVFVNACDCNIWDSIAIKETSDSIRLACNWLKNRAAEEKIELNIEQQCHTKNGKALVIQKKLAKDCVYQITEMRNSKKSQRMLDSWTNDIAYNIEVDNQPESMKMKKSESLIRFNNRLKENNEAKKVVLMFFVRSGCLTDNSLAVISYENVNEEYAIIAGHTRPAVIAHELLHLFGADDLYKEALSKTKETKKDASIIETLLPHEVMVNTEKDLNSLMLSPVTRYAIGWHKYLIVDCLYPEE